MCAKGDRPPAGRDSEPVMSELPRKVYFITGGAGFIGSNVARSLASDGHRVIIADWLGSDDKWTNLAGIPLEDIVAPEQILSFLSGNHQEAGAVIHLGAISSTTERDADRIVRHNIRLSIDLWSICAEKGIPFIYASSAAVYGDGSLGFRDSDDLSDLLKLRPLNAYGWSKWVVDRRFLAEVDERRKHPPQWAGLRFFNVYGPHEDHKGDMRSVVNRIYPTVCAGSSISLFKSYNQEFKDGEQKRDFVFVDDCVEVVRWLLRNPAVSGIFNVGSGEARTFHDLAMSVFEAVRRRPQIEFMEMPEPLRAKYQYFTQADLRKLRKAGFSRPFTALEDGVRIYVRDYLEKVEKPSL
jgi:ADP-L-glycero-D-manno-heptose 6-epimerase